MKKPQHRLHSTIILTIIIFSLFLGLQSCNDDEEILDDDTDEEIIDDSDFVTSTKDTTYADAVIITYSEATATAINPFEGAGVSVTISKGDVVVKSTLTDKEINYVLSGISTEGSFRLYSDYKFALVLNGVSIRNDDGPAINIQSGKKASITVLNGTNNRLIDGASYSTSDEDQKGAFFSEGQLIFSGNGILTVYGRNKHGIVSDDYISITQGNIIIASAKSDGLHANDYIKMTGGQLTVNVSSDGIDAEEGYIEIAGGTITVNSEDDGITASYEGTDENLVPYVQITGGAIQVTTTGDKANAIKSEGDVVMNSLESIVLSVSGKASKGIKAAGDIKITRGDINIRTTGAAFYDAEDLDISAAAGINCDGNIIIEDGTLTITSTGSGGKGISVDGTLTMDFGKVNITASGEEFKYNNETSEAKGIKSDDAIVINGGEMVISAADDGIKSEKSITVNGGSIDIVKSTEGIEAPVIDLKDGNINVVSFDDCLNATKGNGGESNDGSLLTISGGMVLLNSSLGDGMDSNGSIIMTNGTVIVQGPALAPEVALDYNGAFQISGGLLIASGPNSGNLIQATSTSSTQYTALIKMNSGISSNTLFNIQDASGNSLVTYKPLRNAYYFVFSSSSLLSGSSYKVFTGGSVSGGTTTNGLTIGGNYSGGTQKGTFSISSKVTSVTM